MQYQIICLKNRSFWNKILLFIALFVVAVYCISLVMPVVEKQAYNQATVSQQSQQNQQNDEETKEA